WQTHGKTEIPYTMADLKAALAKTTGSQDFANDFFQHYIEGRDVVDYEALLAQAGLLLRKARPGQATLGRVQIQYPNGMAIIASPTLIGSPLYEAGLDRGDRILALDGKSITTAEDIASVLTARKPGDVVEITFEQRGRTRTVP